MKPIKTVYYMIFRLVPLILQQGCPNREKSYRKGQKPSKTVTIESIA